jgi:hypothetical membrane protein
MSESRMDQETNFRSLIVNQLDGESLLALAGIVGPLILVVCDWSAALTAKGYNIIRDSISSLAWTNLGWLQTIGFLAIGLLMEMYVAGLIFNIRPWRGYRISAILLVLSGFGLLMIGAFHADAAGGLVTVQGDIHLAASRLVFLIFPIAILILSFSIKRDSRWQNFYLYTLITVFVGVVLIIVVLLVSQTRWFGLFERLLVANMIIWIEVTAIKLFRFSMYKKRVKNASNSNGVTNRTPPGES